jgi:hypothetical protein
VKRIHSEMKRKSGDKDCPLKQLQSVTKFEYAGGHHLEIEARWNGRIFMFLLRMNKALGSRNSVLLILIATNPSAVQILASNFFITL